MPTLGRTKRGHVFNLCLLATLLAGASLLTVLAIREDGANPEFQASLRQAHQDAARVVELARAPTGIPPAGAATLLRQDARTQGPRLFSKNCASCHRYGGHDGTGAAVVEPASAPDLADFGSRRWVAGFLNPEEIDSPKYFGNTKHKAGKMARFVKQKVSKYTPEQQQSLTKVIAALSAEAGLRSQREIDSRDASQILEGRNLLRDSLQCTDCHMFRKPDEEATAPDLTGWGSREWLIGIISNPAHGRFYGSRNDRMPRFGEDGVMDALSIEMLADWMRGEWYEPVSPR